MNLQPFSQVSGGIYEVGGTGPGARLVGDEASLAYVEEGALAQLAGLTAVPGASFVAGFANLRATEAFPAGAVLATASRDAALVPDGAGTDINCGLRLLSSHLTADKLEPFLDELCGLLGSLVHGGDEAGAPLHLSSRDVDDVLNEGCRHLVTQLKIGTPADLELLETDGHYREASAGTVSSRAKSFAGRELGTLGSGGSHFVEIEVVDHVFDPDAARQLGLFPGQVVVQIHAGAGELGRHVHTDAIALARDAAVKHGERQPGPLAFVSLARKEGERAFTMLQAACNYGLANRHVLAHRVRDAFKRVVPERLGRTLRLVCDVSNNDVRMERWDGELTCVHRRGVSTAYGPGHREVPAAFRAIGQPLLVPGSMGSPSFVMTATDAAEALAGGSAPHGAGRAMSRPEARRQFSAHPIREELERQRARLILSTNRRVAEEAPGAYRDSPTVALGLQRAGIARAVAQLRPWAMLKA